jgi:hypothetical protein
MESSAILRRLSSERISTYRQHAPEGSDRDRAALDLYERNLLLSGILYQGLAIVEVVVRNAIHEALSRATFGSESAPWWEDTKYQAWLEPRAREKLESVLKRSKSSSLPVGQVVAALPFGFWTNLVAKRYTATLWPTIQSAFSSSSPPKPDRECVASRLESLRTLRNRIAHHEPVFHRCCLDDYDDMVTVVSMICPETAAWFQRTVRRSALCDQARWPGSPATTEPSA